MGTGGRLPGDKVRLMPRLWMRGTIPPPPHVFIAWCLIKHRIRLHGMELYEVQGHIYFYCNIIKRKTDFSDSNGMKARRSSYKVLTWRQRFLGLHKRRQNRITQDNFGHSYRRLLGSPRRRWEDNIRMDLREIGGEAVDQMHLAYSRGQWGGGACEHCNEPCSSMKVGNFMTRWVTLNFSRTAPWSQFVEEGLESFVPSIDAAVFGTRYRISSDFSCLSSAPPDEPQDTHVCPYHS
jgi:hypothetical protein